MPKRPVHETWPELDDDALLDLRMADLPLAIEGTLAQRIELLREDDVPRRPDARGVAARWGGGEEKPGYIRVLARPWA